MSYVELFIDWQGQQHCVGQIFRQSGSGRETVTFQYDEKWIAHKGAFSIDPSLPLGHGIFVPGRDRELFGGVGDSAPDQWGRRLMRRAERRRAKLEGRSLRTLFEIDYLLGVSDETRLGALRFKRSGDTEFQSPVDHGVPSLIDLGRLLRITERIIRDEESDEDLQLIFAPGSSLGGARPKASIMDQHGHLSFAKFPKENDEYSVETWEEVALRLAEKADIQTPVHSLVQVAGKAALLSRRFDRINGQRIPFISAMSMTESIDGEGGSYLDIVDVLGRHGSQARLDRQELFRRMVLNILISNVDDHMRNHAFLRFDSAGWRLSPVYDLNPVPQDLKPRILSTTIDYEDATCSIELALDVAEMFGLTKSEALKIIANVAKVTSGWRKVARDVGASEAEIKRMESAFEHSDLQDALKL